MLGILPVQCLYHDTKMLSSTFDGLFVRVNVWVFQFSDCVFDWLNEYKGKTHLVSSLLSVLSCVTAALWSPDVWRVPTHRAGLQHQRGVCSLTRIWDCLTRDSLRSHRLKVQSCETAHLTSDANPGLPTTSVWCGYKLEVPTDVDPGCPRERSPRYHSLHANLYDLIHV